MSACCLVGSVIGGGIVQQSKAAQTRPSPASGPKRIWLPHPGFVEKQLAGRKYVVFVPGEYSARQSWPAIMFLHGKGERGTDGRLQCTVGLGPAIADYEREGRFPFVAIFPQAIDFGRADDDLTMAILDKSLSEYRIDPDRVYLTGLSMGGAGTWRLAARHPDRFAAIAPVCGRTDPRLAGNLRHMPVWCFHGDADPVIPVEESRRMIAALRKLGAAARYTEYPGVTHNSWDAAYGTRELYTWFLEHRRRPVPASVSYRFPLDEFRGPHGVWWLRIEKATSGAGLGSIEAEMAADALIVTTENVQEASVLVDALPSRAGLPRTVRLNGRDGPAVIDAGRIILRP